MNKPIIIGGVDVSGCEYAENSIPVDCDIDTCFCQENQNCYYKQLQRLKAENHALRRSIKDINIVKLSEKYEQYKQALETIQNFATIEMVEIATRTDYDGFLALKGISAKINKVLKDE